ncbi:hypothetical protein HMPREF1982_02967 [Clostridiales bacterium oral taxon 876 str. F0540]|nr:hypothetical protein HMPREF1982_02967 [Clostridiales bacterium oral taxon 876 str. F0540]
MKRGREYLLDDAKFLRFACGCSHLLRTVKALCEDGVIKKKK